MRKVLIIPVLLIFSTNLFSQAQKPSTKESQYAELLPLIVGASEQLSNSLAATAKMIEMRDSLIRIVVGKNDLNSLLRIIDEKKSSNSLQIEMEVAFLNLRTVDSSLCIVIKGELKKINLYLKTLSDTLITKGSKYWGDNMCLALKDNKKYLATSKDPLTSILADVQLEMDHFSGVDKIK